MKYLEINTTEHGFIYLSEPALQELTLNAADEVQNVQVSETIYADVVEAARRFGIHLAPRGIKFDISENSIDLYVHVTVNSAAKDVIKSMREMQKGLHEYIKQSTSIDVDMIKIIVDGVQ